MNIPKLLGRLPGVVALLLALLPLRAQETNFFVESLTANAGEEFAVNVKATNFEDLVGVQLSIHWDREKLDYLGLDNIFLDGTPESNFNRTQLDSGRLGYLIVDPTLNGFGTEDTVLLFTVIMKPTSIATMTTEIDFGDAPVRFSAMDNDNNRLDCNKDAGTIMLENPNGLVSFAEDPRFTVSPNPFAGQLLVTSSLNYSGSAVLEILDISGRLIKSEKVRVPAGRFTIALPGTDFPEAGAYIVRLATDREQLHRKVIRLDRR